MTIVGSPGLFSGKVNMKLLHKFKASLTWLKISLNLKSKSLGVTMVLNSSLPNSMLAKV
jgi:hypothetical protein